MADVFQSGAQIDLATLFAPLHPFIKRDAQLAARMRVAKAMVPAPPDALIPALLFLGNDPEKQVKDAAIESLVSMPAAMLMPAISQAKNEILLDNFARMLRKNDDAIREVVLNNHTADDTIRYLASVGTVHVCDTIGRNQMRALRYPAIIEAIYLNPRAPHGVVQGLLELAVRSLLPLDHLPGFRETKAILGGEESDDGNAGLSDAEFASAMMMATSMMSDNPNEEVQEKRSQNLQQLISKMSVAQKVRIAMVGDASVRKFLIRDPKKIVAMSVLKSPRLTEGEVTLFAANKTLNDDLMKLICRNRLWTKDYATRKALVFNPKTPMAFALGFLKTLSLKDVKDCSSSRDVNQTVARAAKRQMSPDKKHE